MTEGGRHFALLDWESDLEEPEQPKPPKVKAPVESTLKPTISFDRSAFDDYEDEDPLDISEKYEELAPKMHYTEAEGDYHEWR